MEDGDREAAAAAAAAVMENGAEDCAVVKAAAGEGGCDQGDLAGEPAAATGGSEDAAPAAAVAKEPEPAESKAPATKKGGSGNAASEARKAKAANGKAPAGAAKVKKPGVLSQSVSFPARGPPKQAKPEGKAAVANGSGVAGRAVKKVNSARTPVARRSMPVKSESVDAASNDASSALQESQEPTIKPLNQIQTGKTEDDVQSATSSTNTPRSAARKSAAFGFSFRLEQRAEKRKEFFQKLEEKIQAKELEQTNLQEKSKESQEAEIKLLRKSLTFKATPMPSFYKEQPPKVELKKIPPTRARSPKLGRHKPASSATAASANGSVSCESPRSTGNSGKANDMENNKPRVVAARKPVQRPASKTASQVSATVKAETKPIFTKSKSLNSKPKVSRTKTEQVQGNPVDVTPSELPAMEVPSAEHGVEEATGPDLASPLVASNEVPVHG
ncbi:hypothetical protein QOZ80_9BG0711150 [Eleusine coracana subsp. coracana]|nr:hypothetical protein QOZ80_9BG0711150 [Eleusine coracana subsp. coracana]